MKAKSIHISILIFCFALYTASTFKYAYDRTGSNLVMSITFTIHCLLVKAGLVEPFIVVLCYNLYSLLFSSKLIFINFMNLFIQLCFYKF